MIAERRWKPFRTTAYVSYLGPKGQQILPGPPAYESYRRYPPSARPR